MQFGLFVDEFVTSYFWMAGYSQNNLLSKPDSVRQYKMCLLLIKYKGKILNLNS